ncbi:hypothetical protein Patl1_31694 [Pistacia atlantica]|uniref:Uncharacterized protein n=1 Tax=Pistacia atlantica TaxID=434234 RepID=A0ACC1AN26_9ROSI|nr:hypothetical protein Patl1_31694 [Pistacia atlantica]
MEYYRRYTVQLIYMDVMKLLKPSKQKSNEILIFALAKVNAHRNRVPIFVDPSTSKEFGTKFRCQTDMDFH